MLDAADRTVLTEALRPPSGFRVDRVISTTYTLDLIALLTLPMSFTLRAGDGVSDSGRVDPIALLESLRRHAGHLHVFYDASHIPVPRGGQLLLGYLEASVIEARAPKGGSFHSKVTIVRYIPDPTKASDDGDERPADDAVRYRLLCGSRNLTFDRSWDTMLVLDGEVVVGRTLAFARNRRLSHFIEALPGFAVRPLPAPRIQSIHEVADELLRVHFEPPEGFGTGKEELTFWPIGLDGNDVWPFKGCAGRLMVVSPFVDEKCFERFKTEGDLYAVVSRPEELDALPPAAFDGIEARYILADAADIELAEAGLLPPADDDSIPVEPSGVQLRGLHAKLFVADAGWDTRIWTGSANATNAAFTRNVEFLVELRGKKSLFGVDALLDSPVADDIASRRVRFRDLLIPYRPPKEAIPEDLTRRKLERMLDAARRALVDAQLISRVGDTDFQSKQVYEVRIEATVAGAQLSHDIECTLRPISLTPDRAASVGALSGLLATFDSLAFESLTGFCAVTLTASIGSRKLDCDFVLSAPLVGGPPDRENRLLLAMLSNWKRLLQYLLMLLKNDETSLPNLGGEGGRWGAGSFGAFGLPLLEPMLRMLANDPSRLTPVDRLLSDLEATAEGRKLLPDELVALWKSIQLMIPAHQTPPREEADVAH